MYLHNRSGAMAQDRPSYASVEAMVRSLSPSYPVFGVRRTLLSDTARRFVSRFPGAVLYAVKCNPSAAVLQVLHDGGINGFDVASPTEISLIRNLLPDSRCYYHHPVKSPAMITSAFHDHGIRYFAVDHRSELDKVLQATAGDPSVVVMVRIVTPKTDSVFNLASKFGAGSDAAVDLMQTAAAAGVNVGLCFHVGSQCRSPAAYGDAIELAESIAARAGVRPVALDVGGGFPVSYPNSPAPPVEDFFVAIANAFRRLDWTDCALMCEPGRALVAEGQSLIVQVHLRKGRQLYINDGVYGSLMDLKIAGLEMPIRMVPGDGRPVSTDTVPFTVFGPTCDSFDVLPMPWALPADIGEGDWIEVGLMGAYANAVATRFNGFSSDTQVFIDD